MELTTAEMYSGIGGMRSGLEKSGWKTVWANDIDKYACQIYRKNFGDKELVEGDIRTINVDTIPKHELLTAGFPCPSFSLAGKRKGFEDSRGTLFFEITRIAEAKRPRLLLLENVKGLLSNDEGRTFAKILQTLDDLGYDIEWQVLNSKHFGVPQNRERVFIVGHLRGESSKQIFPVGCDGEAVAENGAVARTLQGGGHSGGLHSRMTAIKDGSENLILQMKRTHADGSHIVREYHNEVPTLTQQMGTGGNNVPMVQVQPVLTPDRIRKRQHGRRFKENGEPAFTLTGQDIHDVMIANTLDRDGYLRTGARPRDENGKPQLLPIGYRRIRRLTPTECERLQGFPDGWTAKGLTNDGKETEISDTQRYKVLGNAVTTNVIEFLGQRLSSLFYG